MAKLDQSNLKAGDVIEFPKNKWFNRLVAIVREGEPRYNGGAILLGAWKFDGSQWVINPRGNTSADNGRLLTGHEADIVHADYAAAILLGEYLEIA